MLERISLPYYTSQNFIKLVVYSYSVVSIGLNASY